MVNSSLMTKKIWMTENVSFEEAIGSLLSFVKRWEEHTSLIGKNTKSDGVYLPVPAFSINFWLLFFSTRGCMETTSLPVRIFSSWEVERKENSSFAAVHQSHRHRFCGVFFQLNMCLLVFRDFRERVSLLNTWPNLHGWAMSKFRALDSELSRVCSVIDNSVPEL